MLVRFWAARLEGARCRSRVVAVFAVFVFHRLFRKAANNVQYLCIIQMLAEA